MRARTARRRVRRQVPFGSFIARAWNMRRRGAMSLAAPATLHFSTELRPRCNGQVPALHAPEHGSPRAPLRAFALCSLHAPTIHTGEVRAATFRRSLASTSSSGAPLFPGASFERRKPPDLRCVRVFYACAWHPCPPPLSLTCADPACAYAATPAAGPEPDIACAPFELLELPTTLGCVPVGESWSARTLMRSNMYCWVGRG